MPSVADVSLARTWAEALEDREAKRQGRSVSEVRNDVARKIGVPAGKLYSLRRNRLKDVSNRILTALGQALRNELQTELLRVEHDLQITTQIGEERYSGEVQTLLARREKIRAALDLDGGRS